MELVFRKAEATEIDTAFQLMKEAAVWLKENGIDYWQDWHNPPQSFKDWIAEGFRNREFYFAENDNGIVGMFRLQYEDQFFWGKRTDRAGYIHSFTTTRINKGSGIGAIILRYIEEKLTNEKVDFMRLDCSSNVQGLCQYYEENGFRSVGETELFGDGIKLYEKRVTKKGGK